MTDVIIVGAGAAGLMAAQILSEQGRKVTILEARDRIGGRIHSLDAGKWGFAAQGGAEFIHGNLEVTLALLKKAGIKKIQTRGDMWQVHHGTWMQDDSFMQGAEQVIAKLKKLKEDVDMHQFLQGEFGGAEHEELRQSVYGYVEGYYAADPKKLSAKSFLEEWESEDEQQYRPAGGYGSMLAFLENSVTSAGGDIQLSTIVKRVAWQPGQVQVTDAEDNTYTAPKIIITIPIGVWLSQPGEIGHIAFEPALDDKSSAAAKLGFGVALKILMKFKHPFWLSDYEKRNIGFIFSDEAIGTWWTQSPSENGLLVGWVAGSKAIKFASWNDEQLLEAALTSLAAMFKKDKDELMGLLDTWAAFNWQNDPFAKGAYSYSTLHTQDALQIMSAPVNDTLFFAGEGLYNGTEMGTVEAALTSGKDVAAQVLQTK